MSVRGLEPAWSTSQPIGVRGRLRVRDRVRARARVGWVEGET